MQVKHIYWFAFYNPDSPSVRYRGKYVLEYLNSKSAITYTFYYPQKKPHALFRFILIFFGILFFRKKNSLIVFQKICSNRIYANCLKLLLFFRKQNTVYDIDDAEYMRFPEKNIIHFIRNCETCVTGSESLEEYARKYNPRILFLTSPLETERVPKEEPSDIFTVGWIGEYSSNDPRTENFSHKANMENFIFPALKNLSFPFKILLVGIQNEDDKLALKEMFSAHPNITLEMPEIKNWQNENELNYWIKQFHVGLSPLIDNEFSRAKSAFKLKQYFSCGVPSLASPVGENRNVLKDGENGFFCKDANDYAEKLIYFRNLNKQAYRKFSENAINSCNAFNLQQHHDAFLEHFTKPS